MIYKLYALYDKITEEFGAPMLAKSDGHIVRILKEQLRDHKYAFDYDLYQIGEFDVSTGLLEASKGKKMIHLGLKHSFESESEPQKQKELTNA